MTTIEMIKLRLQNLEVCFGDFAFDHDSDLVSSFNKERERILRKYEEANGVKNSEVTEFKGDEQSLQALQHKVIILEKKEMEALERAVMFESRCERLEEIERAQREHITKLLDENNKLSKELNMVRLGNFLKPDGLGINGKG